MSILSTLGDSSFSCLCGLLLVGAAAGCSSNDNTATAPDMAAPKIDAGLPVPHIDTVNLAPDMSLIKFDDSIYSTTLHKVIVPGAATGNLFLIDPDTLAVTTIPGFPKPLAPPNGGITTLAEGNGLLYVGNQTDNKLYVVDPMTNSIVTSVGLAGSPDFMRYTSTTNEIWVTEPDIQMKIEVFSAKTPRKPSHSASIAIAGGPQGLAIDDTRKVAYTTAMATTMTQTVDLQKRTVTSSWASGCADPKGIITDEPDALAFVGCGEGGATAVNVVQNKMMSQIKALSTADTLGYAPTTRHLFIPGSSLVIAGVSTSGVMTQLIDYAIPGAATKHALADDRGHVWILQPNSGQILRVLDDQQASH